MMREFEQTKYASSKAATWAIPLPLMDLSSVEDTLHPV